MDYFNQFIKPVNPTPHVMDLPVFTDCLQPFPFLHDVYGLVCTSLKNVTIPPEHANIFPSLESMVIYGIQSSETQSISFTSLIEFAQFIWCLTPSGQFYQCNPHNICEYLSFPLISRLKTVIVEGDQITLRTSEQIPHGVFSFAKASEIPFYTLFRMISKNRPGASFKDLHSAMIGQQYRLLSGAHGIISSEDILRTKLLSSLRWKPKSKLAALIFAADPYLRGLTIDQIGEICPGHPNLPADLHTNLEIFQYYGLYGVRPKMPSMSCVVENSERPSFEQVILSLVNSGSAPCNFDYWEGELQLQGTPEQFTAFVNDYPIILFDDEQKPYLMHHSIEPLLYANLYNRAIEAYLAHNKTIDKEVLHYRVVMQERKCVFILQTSSPNEFISNTFSVDIQSKPSTPKTPKAPARKKPVSDEIHPIEERLVYAISKKCGFRNKKYFKARDFSNFLEGENLRLPQGMIISVDPESEQTDQAITLALTESQQFCQIDRGFYLVAQPQRNKKESKSPRSLPSSPTKPRLTRSLSVMSSSSSDEENDTLDQPVSPPPPSFVLSDPEPEREDEAKKEESSDEFGEIWNTPGQIYQPVRPFNLVYRSAPLKVLTFQHGILREANPPIPIEDAVIKIFNKCQCNLGSAMKEVADRFPSNQHAVEALLRYAGDINTNFEH